MPVKTDSKSLLIAGYATACHRTGRRDGLILYSIVQSDSPIPPDPAVQAGSKKPIVETDGGHAGWRQRLVKCISRGYESAQRARKIVMYVAGKHIANGSEEHARSIAQAARKYHAGSAAALLIFQRAIRCPGNDMKTAIECSGGPDFLRPCGNLERKLSGDFPAIRELRFVVRSGCRCVGIRDVGVAPNKRNGILVSSK